METPAKTGGKTAAEVCKPFALSDEAKGLLRADMGPRAFLDLLIKNEHFTDAVRLTAHALPKREAVWWSARCTRLSYAEPPAEARATLQAVERWVVQPTDEHRRAAFAAAQEGGLGTPAGQVGSAVFFTSGSMTPPDVAEVPPPEYQTATAASTAVILGALQLGAAKIKDTYRKFLAIGLDVAAGKDRWKEPAAGK